MELLEAIFLSPRKQQPQRKNRQTLHEIVLKLQYKCVEVPQSSISVRLFMLPFFFEDISTVTLESTK